MNNYLDKMNMKKYFAILFLCLFVATFCQAQAKVEKAECDTTNYNLTMVLSCPQSKDVLYRSAKEWLASHIPGFQQKLQYDDKEYGTIKFRNSTYLSSKKNYRQKTTIDMTGTIDYMVTINIKDGRFRVKSEDAMANWQESFIFNGTRQYNGRKSLELKNFLMWTRDVNAAKLYSADVGKIADGIWVTAREIKNDDF